MPHPICKLLSKLVCLFLLQNQTAFSSMTGESAVKYISIQTPELIFEDSRGISDV